MDRGNKGHTGVIWIVFIIFLSVDIKNRMYSCKYGWMGYGGGWY